MTRVYRVSIWKPEEVGPSFPPERAFLRNLGITGQLPWEVVACVRDAAMESVGVHWISMKDRGLEL